MAYRWTTIILKQRGWNWFYLPTSTWQMYKHANEPPRIPCKLSKALRKSGHESQRKITRNGFALVFFDMKFQFFAEFINFIGHFISNITKCFCVPSKTLKKIGKTRNFMKKKKKIGTWHPEIKDFGLTSRMFEEETPMFSVAKSCF